MREKLLCTFGVVYWYLRSNNSGRNWRHAPFPNTITPQPMNCINLFAIGLQCLAFLVVKDVYYFIQNGEESDLITIFCVSGISH